MQAKYSERELGYTGGIIDGEGYIGIRKVRKPTRRGYVLAIKVHVANTNEWIIRWLQSQYGGSIYKHHWDGTRKDDWQWCLQTKQALSFLRLILPYIHIKKRQAELAISFGSRRKRGHNLTEKNLVLDEAQRILIQGYNSKGK